MTDNIVRPNFGRKVAAVSPIAGPSSPEVFDTSSEVSEDYMHVGPLEGEALLRAQKDLAYMLINAQFVSEMRDKLTRAGDDLFGLEDFSPHSKNVQLRREGLKSASLEEICDMVSKTHQLQWRSQPSYLGALTLEYHYRVQHALSIMSKDSDSEE